MKFLKNLWQRLRKPLKFSVENPVNFEEVWSFGSTGLRVISLLLVVVALFSMLVLFLFSGSFSDFQKGEMSIEREQLEKQSEQIEDLTEKLIEQENYILAVRKILTGEVPVKSDPDSLYLADQSIFDSIRKSSGESEKELAQKVREDALNNGASDKKAININYFGSPVLGVVSQGYDKKMHPGIDVVTKPDEVVKSCMSGTVIYSGFTRKDGHIVIIDHSNGFLSVYKHNRTVLKNTGTAVKRGDPIAIVGNTGENSDGPHLHFELWFEQNPVNPAKYMRFKK